MKPMLRPISFLTLLVLLAVPVFADTPPPSFGLRFGMGVVRLWDDDLNSTLRSLGKQSVDQGSLVPMSWALSFNFGGLETDVTSTRTTNTLFGTPSGSNRTRLVIDSADLTFGSRWNFSPALFATAGLGVEISELLLQTYAADASTVGGALGQAGQISLVSRWNWSPSFTARLGWRFTQVAKSPYGWALGIGVTASGFFLPMKWKIADDVSVSGIDKPWGPSVRPMVWIGIE
jgi:hypothetical protein